MSSDSDSDSKKKLGSRKRGVSDMFRTSYRTHIDLSGIADNKSNIMISINGIIISIVIASISPKIDSNPWLLIPTSILLITSLSSMVYAVLSARPRVSKEKVTLDDVRENRAKKYKLLRIAYNIFMVGLVFSVLSFIVVFIRISG